MIDTLYQSFRRLSPRRRLALTCGALALLGLAVFGVYWWNDNRFAVETDNAYVRADVVTISAQISGEVVEVAVADNQRIEAGAVLLRIDDRDYRARLRQAEGAVQAAEADVLARRSHLASLEEQLPRQRSVIAQASAIVRASQAEDHRSQQQLRRQATLSDQQATSAERLEAAQADARKADARLAETRAALEQARQALPILAQERLQAAAELERARGALRQATAERERAQLALQHSVLRAPRAGTIGQRNVRPGQYAEIGMPLMALVPTDPYVVANYKETQSNRIRPGQPVRVRVDAFDGAVLRGHVDSFAPASGAQFALLPPDNATGNFTKIVQRLPLKIRLDPGQARMADLRPGMSVETRIDTRGADQ